MSTDLREGDRVHVRGMNRRVLYEGTVRRRERNLVQVIPDGKAKPLPVPIDRVSPIDRRGPALDRVEVVPNTERPELNAVPRPPEPARDETYLTFVRAHPCMGCGSRRRVEAHHWARIRALAKKVDDYRTVPLCRDCHDEAHTTGSLQAWTPKQTKFWFLVSQNELLVEWAIRMKGRAA